MGMIIFGFLLGLVHSIFWKGGRDLLENILAPYLWLTDVTVRIVNRSKGRKVVYALDPAYRTPTWSSVLSCSLREAEERWLERPIKEEVEDAEFREMLRFPSITSEELEEHPAYGRLVGREEPSRISVQHISADNITAATIQATEFILPGHPTSPHIHHIYPLIPKQVELEE